MTANQDVMVGVGRKGRKKISLKRVALAQRSLQRAVALYLVLMVVTMFVQRSSMLPSPQVAATVALVFAGGMLVAGVWGVVSAVRLQISMGRNVIFACFMAIGLLVPLLNIIMVASHDSRASKMLKSHGVKVGLLGVPKDELHKLVQGACRGCGYDIREIKGPVCPECGMALPGATAAAASAVMPVRASA